MKSKLNYVLKETSCQLQALKEFSATLDKFMF